MLFLVNEEKIDVTLESEKNAYDVVRAFKSNMDEGIIIASLEINGKVIDPESESLKDIAIEKIETIKIEAGTQNQVAMYVLDNCKAMLMKIAEDMKSSGFTHISAYNESFDWVLDTIDVVNQIAPFEMPEVKILSVTIKDIKIYLSGDEKEDSRADALANVLLNLIQYLDSIEMKFSADFEISREDLLRSIQDGIVMLPEISESFQLGKDREALSRIHVIINLLESCTIYIRSNLAKIKEEVEDIDEIYEDVNSILSELVAAFEKGDFVLIGDLMEYELPEKLENYKKIIE